MTENSRLKNIGRFTSATALTLGILFLITAIGFIISIKFPDFDNGWYSMLETNWLIVIFRLHSGLITLKSDPLHGLKILDILILVLFCIMSFGLYKMLKKVNKIWPLIAFTLSVISIILFIVTQVAGRSTIMLSMMIFSFVMIGSKAFNKVTVSVGILASVFLFAGDLTVGINLKIITVLFGIGYVLLTLWLLLIARKLLLLGS